MKTASADLHLIIHSLEPPEKAFIIRILKNNKSDSHYLKLFNLVNKQIKFDEESIFNKVKNALTKKQYINVKNRLNELILSKLEIYHSDSSLSFTLQSQIRRAEILQSKKLFGIALKVLLKAKKIAVEQERFEYWLLINALIILGYRRADTEKLNEYLINIHKEQNEVIGKIKHNEEYRKLLIEVNLLALKYRVVEKNSRQSRKLASILKSNYLTRFENAKTTGGKVFFFYIHILAERLLNDRKKWKKFLTELLNYADLHMKKWEQYPLLYIEALGNLIGAETNPEEKLRLFIKARNAFQTFSSKIKEHLLGTILFAFTNLIENISPAKAVELFNEFRNDINKNSLTETTRLVLYLNMSEIYLLLSDFHNCLKYLNNIVHYKGELRIDEQILGRIYLLICHYELENYELLPLMAKSHTKWMIKKHPSYKAEVEIISCFKKTPAKTDNKEIQKQFFNRLKNIVSNSSEQSNLIMAAHDFFNCWVESKIEKRPLTEIARERPKQIK